MSTSPVLTGKEVAAILKKAGFAAERQRGSHVFMRHPDSRATVIPLHAGEAIGPGLLSKILRDIEMTREELLKMRKN